MSYHTLYIIQQIEIDFLNYSFFLDPKNQKRENAVSVLSCLLRLCNSLFELCAPGFVPESECKSTATFTNNQTFAELFFNFFSHYTHENIPNNPKTNTLNIQKYFSEKSTATPQNTTTNQFPKPNNAKTLYATNTKNPPPYPTKTMSDFIQTMSDFVFTACYIGENMRLEKFLLYILYSCLDVDC